MKAEELRTKAFLALYRKSMSDGVRNYSLLDVTRHSGTPMPPGLDKLVAQKLSSNGWISIHEAEHFDDEEDGHVTITWDGIEAAEALLESISGDSGEVVPAADRYVSITDNQQVAFKADIDALKDAVRGSNDGTEDDREIALYEIAVMESALVAPRIATDLIQRFVDGVLNWIKSAFSTAVIAEVAQRLVQALLKLL